MTAGAWQRVIFSSDCDDEGNCPVCEIDYADCGCPGPTQEETYEYETLGEDEVLYARPWTSPEPERSER